jgi:histidinol-phosphate aminotransferase
VLQPGAELLTGESSFIVYYQLAQILNMPIVRVPMNNYGFDLNAMLARMTPQTRLIAIANPNNPTGTMIRRRELDAFVDQVPDDVLVILDEAYFEYVQESDYPDSLQYFRAGRPVLILRTFSKVFGLAGMRIGYGIAPREIIDALHKVRMTFNSNSPAQAAALAAWDDVEHLEKSVRLNREGRESLYAGLRRLGVKYVPSYANFVLIELERPARAVTQALRDKGVIVRPAWGSPTCMRVSVGTAEQNARFLETLERVL